jgi:uncharacterized protein
MRVIRVADLGPVRWKNGAGSAVDLLVRPGGAGMADFDWRVNLAWFDRDVPFSAFPGVDRVLAVLEGGPFRLEVDGTSHDLGPDLAPLALPGDRPTAVAGVTGPVRVLNVLARRDRWVPSLVALPAGGREALPRSGVPTVALVASGALRVETLDGETEVGEGAAFLVEGDSVTLHPGPGARAFLATVRPTGD